MPSIGSSMSFDRGSSESSRSWNRARNSDDHWPTGRAAALDVVTSRGTRLCRLLTSLRRDLDGLDAGTCLGYTLAVCFQPFDVKPDRAVYQPHDLGASLRCGHTAGKIGDIRTEAAGASFNHDCVSH